MTKFISTFALVIIAHIATAQVDALRLRVARELEDINLTIIPSRYTEELALKVLDQYEESGFGGLNELMEANRDTTMTLNAGLNLFITDDQSKLIDQVANNGVYLRYDDIKKAAISVAQATNGAYIVLISSHL